MREAVFTDSETTMEDWGDVVTHLRDQGYEEVALELLAAVTVLTSIRAATRTNTSDAPSQSQCRPSVADESDYGVTGDDSTVMADTEYDGDDTDLASSRYMTSADIETDAEDRESREAQSTRRYVLPERHTEETEEDDTPDLPKVKKQTGKPKSIMKTRRKYTDDSTDYD